MDRITIPNSFGGYENAESDTQYLHDCVKVTVDPSRLLEVSKICSNLPAFPSEALRSSSHSSVRFHPNDWLTIVAGNTLYLWKYGYYSNVQPHSPCLSFDLPASDLPHRASLVGLIFPPMESGVSLPSPTSCVALSSCGGHLRLWPRLARNYVHVDSTLPAPIGGLYGDEAITLEHTLVPGTFIVATRTGHLVVIDARNAQDGVTSQLLTSHDHRIHSQGLLSGLGRRVSNLFSLVSVTGAANGNSLPARGGENFVFIRLLTFASVCKDKCFAYALFENQLDVWTINRNLECNLEGVYTVGTLVSTLDLTKRDNFWRAIDFAVQPNANETLIYLLLCGDTNPFGQELCLLTIKFAYTDVTLCYTIPNQIYIEWPFNCTTTTTSDDDDDKSAHSMQFALPSLLSKSQQLYPCLLACVYRLRLGQIAIIEVLTGQLVGTLEFSPHSSTNQFACPPAALIGLGNTDSINLFTFLTFHRGLVSLAIKTGTEVTNSSIINETDQMSISNSEISVSKISTKSCISSLSTNRKISNSNPHIIVDTSHQGRLKVNINFTTTKYNITQLCNDDGNEQNDRTQLIRISLCDQLFVALCEICRVYWMGFKEQAINHLTIILQNPDAYSFMGPAFLRVVKRILNEHPATDARWQHFTSQLSTNSNALSSTNCQNLLEPEGFHGFQFVIRQNTTSRIGESSILPHARLTFRSDALGRLFNLWSFIQDNANKHLSICTLMKLDDMYKQLIILDHTTYNDDSNDSSNSSSSASTTPSVKLRTLLNEQEMLLHTSLPSLPSLSSGTDRVMTYHNSKFAHCLIDQDENLESYANDIVHSMEYNTALRIANDKPFDDESANWAVTHVLCGLHLAGELVEFTKAVQIKFAKESYSAFQSVFIKTVARVGLLPNYLDIIKAPDFVLQTLQLMPQLVVDLCYAADKQISWLYAVTNIESISETFNADLQVVLQISTIIEAGLNEVVRYRELNLPALRKIIDSFQRQPLDSPYLLCWITDERPYGIGDALLKLIHALVQIGSGDLLHNDVESKSHSVLIPDYHQVLSDACKLALNLINSILLIAKQRVTWAMQMSTWIWSTQLDVASKEYIAFGGHKMRLQTLQRLRRLRHWYSCLRDYFISIVGDRLHRPEAALSLAEQFLDFHHILHWCYQLESADEKHSADDNISTNFDDGNLDSQDHDLDGADNMGQRTHHRRLMTILKRVPAKWKLADYALEWYLNLGERSRVQSLLSLLHHTNLAAQFDTLPHVNCSNALNEESIDHQKMQNDSFMINQNSQTTRVNKSTHNQTIQPTALVSQEDDTLSQFLHRTDVRDYAWPHLLSICQYDKAANILFEQGCKELGNLGRRKTLFSLAKLAFISSDSRVSTDALRTPLMVNKLEEGKQNQLPDCGNPLLTKIDNYLHWIKLQESLDVKNLTFTGKCDTTSAEQQPLQPIETLIRLYTQSALNSKCNRGLASSTSSSLSTTCQSTFNSHIRNECVLPNFRCAFILLDILVELNDLRPGNEAVNIGELRDELLLFIWCQAIKVDDWSVTDDIHDPVEICTNSFICTLVKDLINNGATDVLELLPSTEQLFASNYLTDLLNHPQFRYLIESGLEYMHHILDQKSIAHMSLESQNPPICT